LKNFPRGAEIEGEASPRALRATRRRNQVLDAANAVFQRHGFHTASMSQIAAEARMSVGHIYRYFDGKEALISAIVERDLDEARDIFERMLNDPAGAPAAFLKGVGDGVAKMLDRQRAALFLEVMAEAARSPKIAISARRQHEAALTCVGALFADGREPCTRFSPAQAVDLMTLVFSGLRLRAIQDPEADVDVLTATIRTFLADLLGLQSDAH
jgi:TetR/AcrR family transcriptional repressor of uid operon